MLNNKKKKKRGKGNILYISLVLMLMLLAPSVLSQITEYPKTGGEDSYYRTETGFWNEALDLDEVTTAVKQVTTPRQTPLVEDLDGDGVNEIILFDASTIKLYQSKDLTFLDSVSVTTGTFNYMTTYDIDGDGYTEILTSQDHSVSNPEIYILEYNGTDLFIQNTLDTFSDAGVTVTEEMIITCRDVEDCLMIGTDRLVPAGSIVYGRAIEFNSTNMYNHNQFYAKGSRILCLPQIPHIAVADYDGDLVDEYVVSFIEVVSGSTDEIGNVYYFDGSTQEQIITETRMGNVVSSSDLSCGGSGTEKPYGRWLTSPLVADISDDPYLETIMGVSTDGNDFIMLSYKSDSTTLDRYPAVFQGAGEMISNPMLFNAMTDTGIVDFCILGYDHSQEELDLLCGSEQTGGIETEEFQYDVSGLYNVSLAYNNWKLISHSSDQSRDTVRSNEGVNLDELVTSYGVFAIDYVGDNELIRIYDQPKDDAVVIPVDVEQIGREDLLVLTDTNLWYIDDGYSNTGASISSYYVNPCIDSTWKQNTTVEVRVTPTDIDPLDLVSARAVLYADTPYEQDSGWSINTTSGTVFSFQFEANQSIGSSTLRLYSRDNFNPGDEDTIDLAFSVGQTGVEFGDCTTEADVEDVVDAVDEANLTSVNLQDNAVRNATNQFAVLTGLSELIILLLFLLIASFYLWTSKEFVGMSPTPHERLGIISFIWIAGIIIGTLVGIIPVALVVTLFVFGVIIIGFSFRNRIMGGQNNN